MAPREMWDQRITAVTEGGMEAVVDAVVERWFTKGFRQENPDEVKRIRGEMEKIIQRTGFKGSFAAFAEYLRTDPRFFYDRSEDLVIGYRDISIFQFWKYWIGSRGVIIVSEMS